MSTITATLPRATPAATRATQQALLLCGIGASLFFLFADAVGVVDWHGYDIATQTTAELSAVDAPSRTAVVPLLLISSIFTVAFGIGVREVCGANHAMRRAGAFLLAAGLVSLLLPFVPIHLRAVDPTDADRVHGLISAATTLLALFAIGAVAASRSDWIRFYSIVTICVIAIFGAATAVLFPRVAANQPTPWLGAIERIAIYAYLSWAVVIAVDLYRHWADEPHTDSARHWQSHVRR